MILRRQCLRATSEAQQHFPRHDERGRFEDTHEEGGADSGRDVGAVAGNQPGPPLVDRVQPKLPRPAKRVSLAAKDKRAAWFDGLDWKAWRTCAYGNDIADVEALKFRKDSIGARASR